MVIEHGAPRETAGRSVQELACYQTLDRLGIDYLRADHESAATMELCRSIETGLGCPICKNLLLTNRQQTDFYLLMMDGQKVFKTKHLSKALGCARLSFASPEQMQALLDVTPGSLTPLGLLHDEAHRVRLVIDQPLLNWPRIGVHPCRNTSTVALETRDLLERLLPALGVTPTVVCLPEEDA